MMIIGVLSVELSVPGSDSLKDKRQVVKSLLANVRNRFNVSASEVEHLDSRTRAGLAFASVSNDQAVLNSALDKIVDYIESNPMCEIVDTDMQFL